MNLLARVLALAAAVTSPAAHACWCKSQEQVLAQIEAAGFPATVESAFHGRVVRLSAPHEAEVELIEVFKAGKGAKRLFGEGPSSDCAVSFDLGQEAVYLVTIGGFVIQCSILHATPEALRRLRLVRERSR